MPLTQAQPGQEAAIALLARREPLFNLFVVANMAEGLGADLNVWTDDGGGLLMRRRTNWMVDAGPDPARFDFAAASALMDSFAPGMVQSMVGTPAGVDPLYAALQNHRGTLYRQFFAVLEQEPIAMACRGTSRAARPDDLEELAALYADAGDMARPREAVERMLPTVWVTEDAGRIVSAGYVIVQSDQAAMVGGIYTAPQFRRKGYASGLVHAISRTVLQSGRKACLFYHNPEAGRIYLRLGYRELGPWRMVRFA